MKTERFATWIISLLIIMASAASGQESDLGKKSDEETIGIWQFKGSLYQYIVPENPNFLVGVVMADQEMTHLEVRYNYEAYKSASFNYGPNFHVGGDVTFDATPMIGVYFGVSAGATFGYRISLEYGRLGLYSEGEYALPRLKSEGNYFYNWSELSYSAPVGAAFTARAGLVAQRTRIYQTGLDVQRGLLAGVSKGDVEGTVYVFNWGWTTPAWVFNVAYNF
jgi:hypothetical protein